MILRNGVLVALVLAACSAAFAETSADRPQGLMWHRSGLAATIPLQIKTTAGTDHVLYLSDVETGERVLAAYIRGGEFFRVVVPPGRYRLQFDAGRDWQGEAALFGPETAQFEILEPFVFASGVARREGHIVDLRDPERVTSRGVAVCQRWARDPDTLRVPDLTGVVEVPADGLARRPEALPSPRYDVYSQFCD